MSVEDERVSRFKAWHDSDQVFCQENGAAYTMALARSRLIRICSRRVSREIGLPVAVRCPASSRRPLARRSVGSIGVGPMRCLQCRPPGQTRRPPHPGPAIGSSSGRPGRERPRPASGTAAPRLTVPPILRSSLIPNEQGRLLSDCPTRFSSWPAQLSRSWRRMRASACEMRCVSWWVMRSASTGTDGVDDNQYAGLGISLAMVSAWPALALIGSFEFLMLLVRSGHRAGAGHCTGTTSGLPVPAARQDGPPPAASLKQAVRAWHSAGHSQAAIAHELSVDRRKIKQIIDRDDAA